MKKMKLAVFTVEEDYAAAVARGIAGYARRVDIRICATRLEAEKAASEMVLLTDVAELREIKNAVYMSGVCTADMLIDMAAEKWYEISGEVFVPVRDGTRIWALYTRQGGCGVTSAALAAAWVLSRDEQNRVLYLNLGPCDDYRDYTESDFEKTEQKRKFLYFISFVQKKISPLPYISRDSRGVWHLRPETEYNSLADPTKWDDLTGYIRECGFFSHVIVDLGKNRPDGIDADIALEIAGNAKGRKTGENACIVPVDDESFTKEKNEDKVKISLSGVFGEFAEGLVRLMEERQRTNP